MVAQGHGIIAHAVDGDEERPAGKQIGDAGSLVKVSAVEQQEAVPLAILPVSADIVGLVGNISQPVVHGAVAFGFNHMSVHVRGLDNREAIVSRSWRFRLGPRICSGVCTWISSRVCARICPRVCFWVCLLLFGGIFYRFLWQFGLFARNGQEGDACNYPEKTAGFSHAQIYTFSVSLGKKVI